MYPVALLDGEPVELGALRLDQFMAGFFFGCGLFETLALEGGAPQFLARHLARLGRSLEALPAVRGPADRGLLEPARLLASLGAAFERGDRAGAGRPAVMKLNVSDGHTLVTFRDAPPDRARLQREGVEVAELERGSYRAGDRFANHKATSYLKQYAVMAKGPLFVNERGEICEGPTANLFAAFDDRVVTPPASAPCLPGIVREVLLEGGRLGGLPLVEEPLPIEALGRAAGCFLTNSVSIALPVRRLLGRELEASAALAARAREAIAAASAREG
ncbi:MAG TPA: aminotransferase class IV [Polyangiaceae bacterium]|nr:aminotransferase class IV [Polyangiaceae bacterium]